MHGFVACLVCLLVIAPRLADALDLGPIEARSALYEPLDARIGIDGVKGGDLDGLKVVLGSPAQFELAGVARLQHLELLEFTLVRQDDGGGYIRVWTDEPIIEPSLTFLVDVDWPRGRAVRGYKLHLPAAVGTTGASSVRRTAAAEAETEPEPASTSPAHSPPVGTTYGPVGSSDTLWSIAARFRPDKSISVQRMMLAILEANPQAFAIRNVNALNAGAILRIPTLDEIGSDDVKAAIEEAQSQNSAWKEYREGRRSAAAAATPESTPAPTARVEVVSPETTPGATEDADASALRGRLALAMEEADTERRQANELKLRLVEAEEQLRKLSRLIDLQNEEIAALRTQLQAGVAATPTPAPSAMEPMPTPAPSAMEPMPTPAPSAMEPMPTPAPSAMEPMPTPAPSAMEPMPTPAPSEMEPMPTPAPSEMEPMPTPAPSEAEPMPTPAPSDTTPDAVEPETTPFGLGALPINPVFLVGGAGLLLILLGVVALLRRRRASSGEDDLAESMAMEEDAVDDSASADDDDLLHELEAAAADLTDDPDAPPRRDARAAPAVDSPDDAGPDTGESAVPRLDPDGPSHGRTAEQWAEETETERALLGMVDEGDDADVSFDIDALTGDDFDSSTPADETGDEFNLDDLEELTALVPDRDSDEDARSDEALADLDDLAALADLAPERDEGAGISLDEAADDVDALDDLAALVPESDGDVALGELADELGDLDRLADLTPEEDADAAFDELADGLPELDSLADLPSEGDADDALDELAGGLDDLRHLAALPPEGDADVALDELAGELDELAGELDDMRDLAALSPGEDADGALDELGGELDDMRDLAALSPEEDADSVIDELAGELDDLSDLAALSPEEDADVAFDELVGELDDLSDLAPLSPEEDADVAFDELADEMDDLNDLAALAPEEDADSVIDELAGELDDLSGLAALAPEGDADPDRLFDEAADDSDDVGVFARLDPERDPGTDESFDATDDDPDALFDDRTALASGSDSPASAPTSGAGEPPVHHAGALEGEARETMSVSLADGGESPDADAGTAGVMASGAGDRSSIRTAPASSGPGLGPDDAEESDLEPELLFDETTDDGEAGAFSLDDIGEDEMQTKLDLAQVYMEMGDADSARGFLEAVLADGDTDQRDIARDMLSRLT